MAKKNRYANLAATQFEVNGRTRRSNDVELHRYEAEAERRNDGRNGLEVLTDFRTMRVHQRRQQRLAKMNIAANDSSVVNTTKRIA